MIAYCRFEVYG